MKKNMGKMDRIVRIILAIVLGALFFTGRVEGTLGYVALIAAVVFLLTAVINFCPLYLPFGLSTNKKEE